MLFRSQVEGFLRPGLRGAAISAPSATTAAVASSKHEGRTILVVDDKQNNLDLAASLFRGSGYRVRTATGIRSALVLAREVRPDLILSDVVMSDGSGYDFIREVKADPRLSSIPFVFITSTTTTESERAKGLALGAARYLFRPLEPQLLLSEIESCLRGGSRADATL